MNAAAGVDFFSSGALPAPLVSAEEAERIAAAQFGLAARARPLGSQQDSNFLLTAAEDGPRPDDPGVDDTVLGVLKIANPAFSAAEIEAQDAAAELLAATVGWLRVGTVQHGPVTVSTPSGPAAARVLRYLPGGTLTGPAYLAPPVVAGIGTIAGEVSRALRYFTHPGLDRVLQWDLRHADRLVARLAGHVRDPRLRTLVEHAARAAWSRVQPFAGHLPRQAVHLDVTDDNVVCTTRDGLRFPDGVIDFGDLTSTWAICELAVAITSVLHHAGVEPCSTIPAIRAFHQLRPLSFEEASVLWPLVVLRAAVLVVSGEQQAAIDAGNAYVTGSLDRERQIFTQAIAVPPDVMTALILDDLGFGHPSLRVPAGTVLKLDPARSQTLDLSSQSDATDAGGWLTPGLEDRLAEGVLASGAAAGRAGGAAAAGRAGAGAVITRYGEARLSASTVLARVSPATVATGVDLWLGGPAELTAPWAGELTWDGPDQLVLTGEDLTLTLSWSGSDLTVPGGGREVPAGGQQVPAGAPLAALAGGSRLRVNLRAVTGPPIPPLVRPAYAAGWLALTADPAPLLGLPPVPRERDDDLLRRREKSFAAVQELYYPDPPRIERGWRHHLAGTDGRVYLDMVNNVTVLGHAHPRIEAAVSRQLRRLNTNSRFNYAAVVEFTERLTALLPAPLDTVFLVNSGSEAVDLALRLSMAATGHRDVVAVREAYHGWTYATDAVSTSTADNPNAAGTRPRWVHAVDAPNSYRGRYRGADAYRYAPEAAELIAGLATSGRPPAAFVAEAYYGNAGGLVPARRGHHLPRGRRAVPRRGLLLLLHRRQPGLRRRRPDRPGRDPR